LIGASPATARAVPGAIGRLAQAPLSVRWSPVETGTRQGVESAHALIRIAQARKPFIALTTPPPFRAELAGERCSRHEAGAFTRAHRRHVGRFEQADGGTLSGRDRRQAAAAADGPVAAVLAEGEFSPGRRGGS
jgi:two-component system nitrogen regulation response regulator GlnG